MGEDKDDLVRTQATMSGESDMSVADGELNDDALDAVSGGLIKGSSNTGVSAMPAGVGGGGVIQQSTNYASGTAVPSGNGGGSAASPAVSEGLPGYVGSMDIFTSGLAATIGRFNHQ